MGEAFWPSSDLHRLDGSAPSVLPEDLNHLVLRQRLREPEQQTGGDWRAEKVTGGGVNEASREDSTRETGGWDSYLIRICRGLRST